MFTAQRAVAVQPGQNLFVTDRSSRGPMGIYKTFCTPQNRVDNQKNHFISLTNRFETIAREFGEKFGFLRIYLFYLF